MSDQRKHEFKLSLQLDSVLAQSANPYQEFTNPKSFLSCNEEESLLTHATHWFSDRVQDIKSYLSLE